MASVGERQKRASGREIGEGGKTIEGGKGQRRGKRLSVTGSLCRKTDPKIATAPKSQSRSQV